MQAIIRLAWVLLLLGVTLHANDLDQVQQLYNEKRYEDAARQVELYLQSEPTDIDALLLAGEIYTQLESPKKALEYYQRAYQRDRSNITAIRRYARALSEAGDHKQALEILQRAIRSNPKNVYLRLDYGQALLAADSIRSAELEITKAREMDKSIPDGFLALGDLYYSQRVYLLAKDNYEQAIKLDPNNLAAREKLALVYFRLANAEVVDNALANEYYSRSLQEWAAIIQRDSTYARAYFEQGKIFFYASRFAEAVRSLRKYIQLRPDAPNATIARWYAAQSLERIGECSEAEKYLRFAIDNIDSVRNKAQLLLARCAFELKKYADAAALYRMLVTEQPILVENTLDRERYGYALILSGDTTTAIAVLRKAVDVDSTRCLTMYRLAELYRTHQQYDDAITLYRRYLGNCADTNAARIYTLMGATLFSANRPAEAIEVLRQSLSLDSSIVFTYRLLAASLKSTGAKIEESLEVLRGGLSRAKAPSDRNLIYTLYCQYLLEAKQFDELKAAAQEWFKTDSARAEAALFLAVGYQGIGDRDSACKYYREALRLNPQLEVARKNLKQLDCK
ncbi:MAG: tetratricopeptide repeat protein [Chlorobi bacterium]|nr:tetratricopeptide repeat protein [Chlorobiota bacterium]